MARFAAVVAAAAFGSLLSVLLLNAIGSSRIRLTLSPCSRSDDDFIKLTEERLARFQQGLRFQTISFAPGKQNYGELEKLVKFIRSSYPLVHASQRVRHTVVNNYSLLYKVQGSDETLLPALFMSHLDVVPTENQNWSKPHFGAEVDPDGYIYARGTIDDKNGVFGILEALEFLLSQQWTPKRTFFIAFGHDEEVHGLQGAGEIAKYLQEVEQVKRLEFISDEGMVVVDDVIPGFRKPAALVGVSEKGYVTVRLTYNSTAGHSSMPPAESVIGVLSRAVTRLEANPQPSQLGRGPEKLLLQMLAEDFDFVFPFNFLIKMVMRNLWLFRPLLNVVLSRSPTTNALIRTTTAITMFQSGFKENVLPDSASVIVNHRIHPSQTVRQVVEHDRQVIADPRIQIEIIDSLEPSPIAECHEKSYAYQVVAGTVKQIFPDSAVMPSTLVAKTDTDRYLQFTHNVYRFTPNHINVKDVGRFHGADERIGVDIYEKAINFYYHLFRNADLPPSQVLGGSLRNEL